MNVSKQDELRISVKSFVTSIAVIFALMVVSFILTRTLPAGEYARTVDAAGNTVIDSAAGFSYTEGGLPFWKWLLSPFLVLGASGGSMLIAVIVFLLVIGGVFTAFQRCGLMPRMLDKLSARYSGSKYRLMAMLCLFFMAMGALIGSFEECIPMVPIVVALSLRLGWDKFTGLGMSLLAVACGFSSGVLNPFTVGIAQQLAGLPMFSGVWLRLVGFVLIYALLMLFLRSYAKKIEKPSDGAPDAELSPEPRLDKALSLFALIFGAGVAVVISSGFIAFLRDYTMIIVAVTFLVAGIVSSLTAGMKGKELAKTMLTGAKNMLPAVLMIMMASSIKYTLETAKVLDTILYGAVNAVGGLPGWVVVLFIYLIVLVMNFFISSGSAKAFMLIPIIVPLAQLFGISPQLCILVFAFGDGFSNVFYPTNAGLLLTLGFTDVGYGSWARWSGKFQALNLILTCGLLLFGFAAGY